MESHGFSVSVFDASVEKVNYSVARKGQGKNISGFSSVGEFIDSLQHPENHDDGSSPADPSMMSLRCSTPLLGEGDILVDGGNSNFHDITTRTRLLEEKHLHFVGTVSGEEGALRGPSLMPAAPRQPGQAYSRSSRRLPRSLMTAVHVANGLEEGSGHLTVHNGIEYGDMQLICEVYDITRSVLKMTADEMSDVFSSGKEGVRTVT